MDEPKSIDGLPGGELLATLRDYDDAVEQLRKRAECVGLSYALIDQLTGLGEGSAGKYLAAARARNLTLSSLLRLCEVLGLRVAFAVDPKLVEKMRPSWEKRDHSKARSRRSPSLGKATLRRVLPAAAAELGRRGGQSWVARTTPEQRRELGRRGALKRWHTDDANGALIDGRTIGRP